MSLGGILQVKIMIDYRNVHVAGSVGINFDVQFVSAENKAKICHFLLAQVHNHIIV